MYPRSPSEAQHGMDTPNGQDTPTKNLRDHVILLVRRLRAMGLPTSPADAVNALAALEHVDLGDPAEVRSALRLVLARRPEDLPVLERELDAFFWGDPVRQRLPGWLARRRPAATSATSDPVGDRHHGDPADDSHPPDRDPLSEAASASSRSSPGHPDARSDSRSAAEAGDEPAGGDPAGHPDDGTGPTAEAAGSRATDGDPDHPRAPGADSVQDLGLHLILAVLPAAASAGAGTGVEADGSSHGSRAWQARAGGSPGGYSPLAVLTRRDVQLLHDEDRRLVMAAASQLGRWLATRPSRRFVRARKGAIDGRRALREAARKAGDLFQWPRRRRRAGRLRLVAVLDVSGSMDVYSQLFLHFLHGLQQQGGRVETFAVGTRLTRLTTVLRTPRPEAAMARAAAVTADWSGGTRLGEGLWRLADRYGHLLDRDTVLLVISDGLDRGDLGLLDRALRACRRRVRALIWLNPLAGDPRYEPLARGMQVALPYVDVLAPAHSLESLVQLSQELRRQAWAAHRLRRTNRPRARRLPS
ncbi:MAG: hypothetical protein DIU76_08885 [Bacillota bacterium]|nr:MAG: hypothetical protein DIU76_08885 [Bacillota bacterium]